MILGNKVVQKLNLEKNVFYKKWSPKLVFLNEKNEVVLTQKNDFEDLELGLFTKYNNFLGVC